jgi:hypothetical protein
MKKHYLCALIALSLHPFVCLAQDAREIARRVLPSVVVVTTYDSAGHPVGFGSGFFVSENIVATNFHVIDRASEADIKVVGTSKTYPVRGVVALNKDRDLVLLQVADVKGAPLTLATDKTEAGDEIYAFGNPEGLEGTISPGIVSSAGTRKIEGENVVQVTTPISRGSSGGPVVNKRGEVIGVAEGFLSEGQNLNFAVPSIYLVSLLSQIGSPQPLSSVTTRLSADTGQGVPSNWLFVASASDVTLYYDPNHIEKPNAETLRVWIKYLPKSNEMRTKMAASIEGEPPLVATTYGYQVWHNEYNCKESASRFISVEDYDMNGKRLRFIENPVDHRTWSADEPGSLGGSLLKKICATSGSDDRGEHSLIGTYTGTWASDTYDVSGAIVLTLALDEEQMTATAAFTGSDYFNEDTLIIKLTPMGSGIWKMDYKGKKSKITGTGLFSGGRFVGDYRFKKFLWVDRGRWNLHK